MSSIKCFDLSPQVHTVQALSDSNFFPLTEKASYILLPISQWKPWAEQEPFAPNWFASSGFGPEMSGLWNFSVRVQSWSDKIESDPVLFRQCKIIYFPFLLELFCREQNTISWRQNSSSSVFASWSRIDTAFWHFQNLTRKCQFGIRRKSTVGVILPLKE